MVWFAWRVKRIDKRVDLRQAYFKAIGSNLIDFRDRNASRTWLKKQSYEVRAAIASRAALRLFPFVVNGETHDSKQNGKLLFVVQRALLIASIAPVLPSDKIASAATSASTSPFAAETVDATAAAASSFSAIAAVSFYAATVDSTDFETSVDAAAFASSGTAVAYFAATTAATDAATIDAGLSAESLMQLQLWHGSNHLVKNWNKAMEALEGYSVDQSFWIDWYQRILDGRPQNWEMLKEIALIDPEDWDKGAEHVNGLIAEIQARYAVKESVEAARNVLEEYPAPASGIGHNNPPEEIEDDPFGAQDAAFVQKLLDDIGEECESSEPDVSVLHTASDVLGRLVRRVGVWIAGKLDMSVDAFFKTLGAGAALTVGGPLVAYLQSLLEALTPLLSALGEWLPFIG